MSRPSRFAVMMGKALIAAERSTCCRRKVGAVLLNSRGHILATGYNGVAAKQAHCIDAPCPGAELPSGTGLDACEALHAEQNALLQCKDVYEIDTIIVTASPCVTCTKLLLNTSCRMVVYLDEYPQPTAKQMWERAGRGWSQIDYLDVVDLRNTFLGIHRALSLRSDATEIPF